MKKRFSLTVVAMLAVQLSSPVAAQEAVVKRIFEARYAALEAAMSTRDNAAISALLTQDFEIIDPGGPVTDSDRRASRNVTSPPDPARRATSEIHSVSLEGDTATVLHTFDLTTIKTGRDGEAINVELINLSTDSWVYRGGVWLLRRTQTE